MKKKLSIITICYNEPNLEKTCKSIVNQTWQDFEWVVIDGGSNKETLDIFEKYKHRIDKFISEPDKGRYNAMNKGINLADGIYLNFMNAGDYFYKNDILEEIFKNKNYKEDILYGDECFLDVKPRIVSMPNKITSDFLISSTLRHQSTFIKTELFKKYGGYNENLKIVSDYEKWIVFYKNSATFRHIPKVVAYYDLNGISTWDSDTAELHNYERQSVINTYFTPKQIEKASKPKYSFFSLLFSVKNAPGKTHKIITLLGMKVKIKRKKNINSDVKPLKETPKTFISDKNLNQSKKILFIYHRNLLKNDTGNNAYCFQIIKTLKNLGYDIDLLATTKICGVEDFENFELLNTQNNNLINKLYTVNDYSQKKYTYSRDSWVSDSLIKTYEHLIKNESYHSIIVNYTNLLDVLRLSKYKTEAKSILIYHDVHSIQTFIADQYYHNKTDFYKFGINISQELDLLNYVDDICCISNDERQFMKKFFRDKNIYFLPFTLPKIQTVQQNKDIDCLFIGGPNHHNILSVMWFMQNVYEHVDKNINITICGKVGEGLKKKKPSLYKKMLQCKNIKFIEFAKDLDELYSRTKISIIPIVSGTGMKIKTVTSYAYGIPVVSTTLGMDGFIDKYENGSLVSDDSICFANYINQLISDQNLYNNLKQKQELYYNTHFSENAQQTRFRKILRQNEDDNVRK